ncbi:MAG: FGGY family carbohydrate kinase [Chitinophagaceae bacterium]
MSAQQVIAVMDVGKTNKKLFLFDKDYTIVHEQSARFTETIDEDGDPCENLESLRSSVFDSIRAVTTDKKFEVKALNFSAYGASFVYVDAKGKELTPLYNYLKPYPEELKKKFYDDYGGEDAFSSRTASPVLGSLNSGMQIYRIKHERPALFSQVKHALHLPQYLSFLVTGKAWSDITSIGSHTNLWDFEKNRYHEWVKKEGIHSILPPIGQHDEVSPVLLSGNKCMTGIGLHDSSAALIPYLMNFHEPFVLISSGTWCISLNPFNNSPLTVDELKKDCLCYLDFKGNPVKASRLFAGHIHDEEVKRIADHFHTPTARYKNMTFNPELITQNNNIEISFDKRDLADFASCESAYHQLMMDLVTQQYTSTQLVVANTKVKRIFVDGGFSKNELYMNLLASRFPGMEVFAASIHQSTALGAALALHKTWNKSTIPSNIISLQYYDHAKVM